MSMDRTASGIVWTGTEKALLTAVGFVQGVILARLLSPHDFGLTAMLGIFLGVGTTLAESGLGTALVTDGGRYSGYERGAFRWNLGIAAALYAVLFLVAPAVSRWYGIELLSPLMRVMALGLPISAVSVVAYARLTREMRFRELALINSLPSVLGAALAILLAWKGCGVWSIVALGLFTAAVRTAFVWIAARRCPPPAGAVSDTYRSFLSLGFKFAGSTLLYTVYSNLYQLVIGKVFSPAAVGVFSRAQRWSRLPVETVNESVGRVAFVAFSRRRGGLARFLAVNCALLWPVLAALWLYAEPAVRIILGEQWLECVPLLRVLILGAFVTPFGDLAYRRILASGRGGMVMADELVKRVFGFALLAVGCRYGLDGLCWSLVAHDVVTAMTDWTFVLLVGKGAHGDD